MLKKIIKSLIPPILINFYRRLLGKDTVFVKNYSSWNEARKNSIGYESNYILNSHKNKFKKHQKEQFRNFDYEEYIVQISNFLYLIMLHTGNQNFHVCDFGGGWGEVYLTINKNKFFLKIGNSKENIKWSIIEQKNIVEYFREKKIDENLFFFKSIDESIKKRGDLNVFLFSSVIQYLPNPYIFFKEIFDYKVRYILIAKTPFTKENKESIKVQKVPKEIYGEKVSYPIHFLKKNKLSSYFLKNGYRLVEAFDLKDSDVFDRKYFFQSLLFERIK